MSIEKQADEVDKVKRSESGMIVDPITIDPDQTIGDAWELMTGLPYLLLSENDHEQYLR